MIIRTNGLSLEKVNTIYEQVKMMERLCSSKGQELNLEAYMEYLVKQASELE